MSVPTQRTAPVAILRRGRCIATLPPLSSLRDPGWTARAAAAPPTARAPPDRSDRLLAHPSFRSWPCCPRWRARSFCLPIRHGQAGPSAPRRGRHPGGRPPRRLRGECRKPYTPAERNGRCATSALHVRSLSSGRSRLCSSPGTVYANRTPRAGRPTRSGVGSAIRLGDPTWRTLSAWVIASGDRHEGRRCS